MLDADIYGPSIGQILGVDSSERPKLTKHKGEDFFVPIKKHHIESMSMSYLVTEKTPMVWRGPMVTGALLQLLSKTFMV